MCNFLSAILKKDGELLYNLNTSSHEDLLEYYGLEGADRKGVEAFVRLEYTPKDNKYADPDCYKLKVDQELQPEWFTDEVEERITNKLNTIIKRLIVKESKGVLLGGTYILADGVRIFKVQNSRILYMGKDTQITKAQDQTIIEHMTDNAHIVNLFDASVVCYMQNEAHITSAHDWSRIMTIRGDSHVENLFGTSSIYETYGGWVRQMGDNSHIHMTNMSTKIICMTDRARINTVRDNTIIDSMSGTSYVGVLMDHALVRNMWDASMIGKMQYNAIVQKIQNSAVVNVVRDDANVEQILDDAVIRVDKRKK